MMKAIGIWEFGGREKLELLELPVPTPNADEVLIKIKSSSINPVDTKIRQGLFKEMFPYSFPIILGWDAAGVVVDSGCNANRFRKGDRVYAYCRKPTIHDGTYAEYITVPESSVALKPENLGFDESACIPLAGLTAYQSLYVTAKIREGETILIHGAAGGVGGFAVQLARERGANIIATASGKNHDYLYSLGVNYAIDYTREDFREGVYDIAPKGVDVVFDCVGGATTIQSTECIRQGGRFVSIVRPDLSNEFNAAPFSYNFVFVEPNGSMLAELAKLAQNGSLGVRIASQYSLQEAAKAHELIETRHVCGKIALSIE